MAEGISVVCPHCGRSFTVSEDLAGLATTCPQCERQVSVPVPPDAAAQRPRLQVRRGTPVAGTKACPSCGAAMAQDAVICIRCGFDTRTGVLWQAKQSRKNLVSTVLAVAGIIIVAGWLRLWMKAKRESGPIGEMPAVVAPTPQSRDAMPPEQPSAQAAATESATTDLAVTNVAVVPSSDDGEESAEAGGKPSREELEAQLTQALNARYPLYVLGGQAVLRQNNGLVYRGEIIALGTNAVTVKTEMGIKEIPFAALDKESRLRCDPEARKRLVALRVDHVLTGSPTK